jgi:hypothetical protein
MRSHVLAACAALFLLGCATQARIHSHTTATTTAATCSTCTTCSTIC